MIAPWRRREHLRCDFCRRAGPVGQTLSIDLANRAVRPLIERNETMRNTQRWNAATREPWILSSSCLADKFVPESLRDIPMDVSSQTKLMRKSPSAFVCIAMPCRKPVAIERWHLPLEPYQLISQSRSSAAEIGCRNPAKRMSLDANCQLLARPAGVDADGKYADGRTPKIKRYRSAAMASSSP